MNFINKITFLILVVSFLLLIYIFYKSEIIWNGYNRIVYKPYYLISLILIFFSIITHFINNKIKKYLIIFFFSLVMSLYLFEGYYNFKLSKKKNYKNNEQTFIELLYEKQTGKKWDTRSRSEIYRQLNKNNTILSYHPAFFLGMTNLFFPLSGHSNLETIFCNENGYYATYKSDRYGFNNPDNEWDKNKIEYLLIGDSFVHGACVNRPNDIASILRNLSSKSVLSLGMSGNGPLIEYATLREYLDKNVKKVLWVYFEGNDLRDLSNEKKNNILIKYLEDLNFTQNLKFKQNQINNLITKSIEKKYEESIEKNKNKLIKFIKIQETRNLINNKLIDKAKAKEPKPLLEFKKILQLTKELTKKNDSKLYFIYLPEWSRYSSNYDLTNYNLVKKIVTELKIPFIDIDKEVFEKEKNPLKLFVFEQWGHYNIKGYNKVSEKIYKFTKD